MEKEKLNASAAKQLAQFIQNLGLELFGYTDWTEIARYEAYYRERPAEAVSAFETGTMEEKCRLSGNFISIAFPYAKELDQTGDANFSIYTRGRDYHKIIRRYLDRITAYIHELGWSAEAYTDSTQLPERLIAALAGLGYLGRNSTLITEPYGSFVFLGEIRTDLPLVIERSYINPGDYSRCGECSNCLKACPVGVLGQDYVETGRCLSEVTQKKYHSEAELRLLGGRLFGCDTCQLVCPHNRDKAGLGLPEFTTLEYMSRPDLLELVFMSKETFKEKYGLTSAGWRGKAVLAKNALAALALQGNLPANWTFDSPVVSEAYHKLLEIQRKAEQTEGEKLK